MKAGFLGAGRAEQPANPGSGKKEWDDEALDAMVEVFLDVMDENSRMAYMDLERRVRSGTGAKEVITGHGHVHYVDTVNIDEDPTKNDKAASLIREHTRSATLRDYVAVVMEQTATMFERVLERGRREGDRFMDADTQVGIQRDILKEVLIRHILKQINIANSNEYKAGSTDAGLLATPQGYFGGDLNELQAETVRGLMEDGYGYQDDWVDSKTLEKAHREMELLDFDNKFVAVHQQKMIGMRSDKIHWVSFEDLDREAQPGLQAVLKKLISIPFELNKKCNLCLQASSTFQFSHYGKDAFYKKHVDSGYDSLDNGRKLTAIFYVNPGWSESDGGNLNIFKRRKNPYQLEKDPSEQEDAVAEGVSPLGGRLVVFRSRDVPHEVQKVLASRRKRYAISMWILGPAGPGDQPDGHYTRS